MDYRTLGRSGLKVSVAGLGTGGHSRLGSATGRSRAESIAIVHAALDLGINFIDTARTYGTQEIVGEALRGRRQDVVLSTKSHIAEPPFAKDGPYLSAAEIETRVDEALAALKTDYIDVFHLHGLEAMEYDHAVSHVLPVLERQREAGKIRFIGVTERFIVDTGHEMLSRAARDGLFDVVMLGFNMLNASARSRVLPLTQENGIGTLDMFAVRRGLVNVQNLRRELALGVEKGQIDPSLLKDGNPLAFLTEKGVAETLTEAAYRFCRHEPGIDVVLTGTGNIEHLKQNVADLMKPPLPREALTRLQTIFGKVDSLSGN